MQNNTSIELSRSFRIQFDSPMFRGNFKSMLNDYSRRFPYQLKRSKSYVNAINEAMEELNHIPPSMLATVPSHKFYIMIRNLLRDLLIDWHSAYRLNHRETFLLRNCVHYLNRLVPTIKDITATTSWLLDPLLINAIANCLSDIDQLLFYDKEKYNFKQLVHLLDLFTTYYRRLPPNTETTNSIKPLFEATMDCFVSWKYDEVFRKLKPNAKSMTTIEKFFLIKCPTFLTSYHGTHSHRIIQQLLETMIPRYASILEKHMKFITEWNSTMMHAVHHVLSIVVIAKGYYTPYAHGQPLQWLIDHIIHIISQSSIVNKVNEYLTTSETILIDSALKTLSVFVHEPDLLVYIKQLRITPTFRSLILVPYESITFHVYVLLSYAMDEDDIKASEKDSGRLLSNIFDSLRREIKILSETSKNDKVVQNNIMLLVEAIRALVQHDQIKSEILKQNALPLLMNNSQYFDHHSRRLILESLGSMTFDPEAAQLLRENTQFMDSVVNMKETDNDGIKKAADKIIWNLIKEPKKVAERKQEETAEEMDVEQDEKKKETPEKYEYDCMISYCHADKELVYRIQQFLAGKGFKIWFDRDNMYGPAMQAMADAVENSEFVILCMSDSYKRSVYCQAEAEYAFHCKRRLLPLIVRQGYRPDGWLGLVMGSRIYVDFGRFEFKKACELLWNEITLQKKGQLNPGRTPNEEAIDPVKSNPLGNEMPLAVPTSTPTKQASLPREYLIRNTTQARYRSIPIDKWTRKDVLDFLFDSKLYSMMPLCELMNGHGFYKLFRMSHTEPSHFYSQLNEELRSRFNGLLLPIGIFTQFLSEIEQITDLLSKATSQDDKPGAVQSKPVSTSSVPSTPVKNVTNKSTSDNNTTDKLASPSSVPSTPINNVTNKFALPSSLPPIPAKHAANRSTSESSEPTTPIKSVTNKFASPPSVPSTDPVNNVTNRSVSTLLERSNSVSSTSTTQELPA